MTPSDLTATRARLGLSQAGLARLLRVQRSTVMRWEDGDRAVPHATAMLLDVVERFPEAGAWIMGLPKGRATSTA